MQFCEQMLQAANVYCVRNVYNSVHGENCANRRVTTAFKAKKDLFPVFLENPQQNLPKFFCSEIWKLSIVKNLKKMLRYAWSIKYSSLIHKVSFKIFKLGLLKCFSSNSVYPFC